MSSYTDFGFGIQAVDISDQNQIDDDSLISTCEVWYPVSVEISGDYLYVAAQWNGLRVINIDPEDDSYLDEVGFCITDFASDLAIWGDYVYVADRSNGLRIIDISVPQVPVNVGFYPSTFTYGVDIADHYAYLADQYGGLVIIDIADPTKPQLIGSSTEELTSARDVAVKERHAFLADENGLRIMDISNPSEPRFMWKDDEWTYDDNIDLQNCTSISVAGNYVYVVGQDPIKNPDTPWVYIVDIYNPQSPKYIGHCETTEAGSVAVNGGYLYLADHTGGLRVLGLLNDSQ